MKRRIIVLLTVIALLLPFCCSCVDLSRFPFDDIFNIWDDIVTDDPALDPTCDHKDGDKNGFCDNCSGSVTVDVDLFAVNDLHGKFSANDKQPGVANLTTYLKDRKKANDNTVVFSSGDMWQGGAEAGLTYGKIMTEWMNDAGFEFMTLGNHEFDWGAEEINNNADLAEFPLLAINVYSTETNRRADFCQASKLVDLGEVQVGFIGAVGDCYSSVSSNMSVGYTFKVGAELTQLVKNESSRLREQGADIIVYSIHDGYADYVSDNSTVSDNALSSYYDTSLSNGYVDIVFEGHTHKSYVFKDSKNVFHLQGGAENQALSFASVTYNFVTDEHNVKEAKLIDNYEYKKSAEDGVVDALREKYKDKIGMVTVTLGNNSQYRSSAELCQLSAKLCSELAEETWGDRYNIVLGGGFTSCRSPYTLPIGEIKYDILYMLFPFNNRFALCSIKGSDLIENFMSGRDRYYVEYTDYGKSVKDSIDPNGTYYIVTDSYTYSYKKNKLTVVEDYEDGVYVRDLIAGYIKDGGYDSGEVINMPAADSHLTVKQIKEIGQQLGSDGETMGKYYLTGTLVSVENTSYGNVYVEDSNGDTLYVYGLYTADGVKYGDMPNGIKPSVGDTITLYGPIKCYEGTVELLRPIIVN